MRLPAWWILVPAGSSEARRRAEEPPLTRDGASARDGKIARLLRNEAKSVEVSVIEEVGASGPAVGWDAIAGLLEFSWGFLSYVQELVDSALVTGGLATSKDDENPHLPELSRDGNDEERRGNIEKLVSRVLAGGRDDEIRRAVALLGDSDPRVRRVIASALGIRQADGLRIFRGKSGRQDVRRVEDLARWEPD